MEPAPLTRSPAISGSQAVTLGSTHTHDTQCGVPEYVCAYTAACPPSCCHSAETSKSPGPGVYVHWSSHSIARLQAHNPAPWWHHRKQRPRPRAGGTLALLAALASAPIAAREHAKAIAPCAQRAASRATRNARRRPRMHTANDGIIDASRRLATMVLRSLSLIAALAWAQGRGACMGAGMKCTAHQLDGLGHVLVGFGYRHCRPR